MSSILNALKKVEEESAQASGLVPGTRRKPGAGDRVRFFLIDRALVLLISVGLIGAGAGGFWAYTTLRSAPAETRTASGGKSILPAAAAKRNDDRPAAVTAPAPAPASKHPEKKPAPAVTPAAPVHTETPVNTPKPMRIPAPSAPPPAVETEQVPASPVRPHLPDTQPSPGMLNMPVAEAAPASETVPVLEDSPLTLQAISWASRPENRIAVINGKICREGEKIEGFRLQQINPDDVRIHDGSNTWRLVFRIK